MRWMRRGRNALLKLMFAVVLALALLQWANQGAHAAEADPRVKCGQTITWTASDTYAPYNVTDLAAWAYRQVAPVTGSRAVASQDWTFDWEPEISLSGSEYAFSDTGHLGALILTDPGSAAGRSVWTHALNGDLDRSDAVWRQAVLRTVVADFGVSSPTSTSSGLSAGDRAALKRICATQAQAKAVTPTPAAAASPGTGDTTVNPSTPAATGDRATATTPTGHPANHGSLPGGQVGLWVIRGLFALLFAYALARETTVAVFKWIGRKLLRRKGDSSEGHTSEPSNQPSEPSKIRALLKRSRETFKRREAGRSPAV